MMTVMTDVRLREGAEQTWDTVMRRRTDLSSGAETGS